MVSSAGFDSSLIDLTGIYHEANGPLQRTNVYANGVMQVMLFLSVNYRGEDGYEEQIKEYVHNNAVIYELDDINGGQNQVTWAKDFTSNGWPHDIEYPGLMKNDSSKSSDIRAPFFFTVPSDTPIGTKKWVGKLNSQQTNVPLTVEVRSFKVSAEDFEIVSRGWYENSELKIIRYVDNKFGDRQTLLRLRQYKGIKFIACNAWIARVYSETKHSYAAAFLEYRETEARVAESDVKYSHSFWDEYGEWIPDVYWRITSSCCWEDSNNYMPESAIDAAWNEGIVIIVADHRTLAIYSCNEGDIGCARESWGEFEFEIEDTFGCRSYIAISWDEWKVFNAYPIYP